jgi:acetyl-CoA acyltransferase
MQEVVVAGVGMTRFGKAPERGLRSLAEEAVKEALGDAGVEPAGVETAFFANAVAGLITGQEMIPGQVALRHTGLLGIPIVNVENACASASSAFHLAWMSVASGMYDVALAVGAEKLSHEDKARSFGAIGTAVDLEQLDELMEALAGEEGDGDARGAGTKQSRSFFMDIYAGMARDYMERSGATAQDFADVSVKNHAHGALNPLAQYGEPVTREQVLASREISGPLTLLMCSPIGEGAAAAVLCSERAARRLAVSRPVRARASVLLSGRDREPGDETAGERAARRAYEVAGVAPPDVDVIELHDAAAPAELMIYEELGLCSPNEGPALLADGRTRLGGAQPVNPSGGLLSKGHPIGATGIAQITEIVWQLRGQAGARQVESPKVGLTENGGGFLGTDPRRSASTCSRSEASQRGPCASSLARARARRAGSSRSAATVRTPSRATARMSEVSARSSRKQSTSPA